MYTRFEWDRKKASANLTKHHVDFDSAVRAFADTGAICELDRIEGAQLRWKTIGRAGEHLILVIIHLVLEQDGIETIRIISARKADRSERRRYEQYSRSIR
jgi:uncharacterized DUF497 family protein